MTFTIQKLTGIKPIDLLSIHCRIALTNRNETLDNVSLMSPTLNTKSTIKNEMPNLRTSTLRKGVSFLTHFKVLLRHFYFFEYIQSRTSFTSQKLNKNSFKTQNKHNSRYQFNFREIINKKLYQEMYKSRHILIICLKKIFEPLKRFLNEKKNKENA